MSLVSEHQINLSPRFRAGIYVLMGLVVVGGVVEMFALKGDSILARSGLRFEDDQRIVIPIQRAGEKHTLEIYTRNYRAKDHKVAIAWELHGPEDNFVAGNSEILPHKGSRVFDFYPAVAGTYELTVQRKYSNQIRIGLAGVVDRTSFSVRVFVNDRRIIKPLLSRLNF